MKFYDPITEHWFDPPAHCEPAMSYPDQQRVRLIEKADADRIESAARIWHALEASATASLLAPRGEEPEEIAPPS